MNGLEIVPVRVPADAVVSAQRHLDEGYAAFDQAPGQQAALAKAVAAVGVAVWRSSSRSNAFPADCA